MYTGQDERIEELRETHRLESGSQIKLVDELRSQIQQSEALLKASRSSSSQLEADIAKQRTEMDQLRAEAEKLSGVAKGEEEKCNKAINHLKTVRQRLVKAEKEREDAVKEVAALKESQKAEHDKEQIDREMLQGELNKLKVEKEVSLADLRAQFEKELMTFKQRSEKEISTLRGQFELETVTAQVGSCLWLPRSKSALTVDLVQTGTRSESKKRSNRSPREVYSIFICRKGRLVRSTSNAAGRRRIFSVLARGPPEPEYRTSISSPRERRSHRPT